MINNEYILFIMSKLSSLYLNRIFSGHICECFYEDDAIMLNNGRENFVIVNSIEMNVYYSESMSYSELLYVNNVDDNILYLFSSIDIEWSDIK